MIALLRAHFKRVLSRRGKRDLIRRLVYTVSLTVSVRMIGLAAASWFLSTTFANAQSLTEARVLELARAQAPAVIAARRSARQSSARATGVGLHPNPQIAFQRQESFAPNAESQDVLQVNVPIDLSGRRRATRFLAELSAAESNVNAESVQLAISARALEIFYGALATKRRVVLLTHAQEALDDAARILVSRESVGEASGYQRARLTLAVELARSRLGRAELELELVTGELSALLGAPVNDVEGSFEVEPPGPISSLLERAQEHRPELSSLDARLDLARRAERASDMGWFPTLTVTGGYNRLRGDEVGHGYTVGLRVGIPVFSRGQGQAREADAALEALRNYQGVAATSVESEVATARARVLGMLAERERFRRATTEPSALLMRAAASGFRGGERNLVELLDAQRALFDVADRQIGLDLSTRLADIALRRATGSL